MLNELLEKALETRADRIEIEYRDGAELVTAFNGSIGIGIEWLNKDQSNQLYDEMDEIKRNRTITLKDTVYRLTFSKYKSFGEWVFVIEIKPVKKEKFIFH